MSRPNVISDEMLAQVQAVLSARRGATMQVLCDALYRRTGLKVCSVAHCAHASDAEWTLAADLFELPEGEGSRGRPAKYDRRAMVDACCYVQRTGC